jgi:hypothetical protein
MTADVKGMSVRDYLAQGEFWVDDRSGNVFQISGMSRDQREYAARQLARTATAAILQAEGEANAGCDLVATLRLMRQNPREWMVRTPLYRALYPDTAGEIAPDAELSGNRTGISGVVSVSGARRLA